MGTTAAKNAMVVADNVHTVLAIELMAAAQAIELRDRRPSPRSARVVSLVRQALPHRREDAEWGDSLERVRALVRSGSVAVTALGGAASDKGGRTKSSGRTKKGGPR